MGRYVLSAPAKADIREIVAYIRQRSPDAAKRVRRELQEEMRRLADFPTMGHLRQDVTDEPLRFWSLYSYLIVYVPDSKPLQVVRVLHGGRDLERQLSRG